MTSADIVALDSGVLIGLGRNDRKAEAVLKMADDAGAYTIIPAPVLAEVLRGGASDAGVNRAIKTADAVVPTTAAAARTAGGRLASWTKKPMPTVDALIVATAEEHRATYIVTVDPDDLGTLVSHAKLVVI